MSLGCINPYACTKFHWDLVMAEPTCSILDDVTAVPITYKDLASISNAQPNTNGLYDRITFLALRNVL